MHIHIHMHIHANTLREREWERGRERVERVEGRGAPRERMDCFGWLLLARTKPLGFERN